jgi:hypothetical protein
MSMGRLVFNPSGRIFSDFSSLPPVGPVRGRASTDLAERWPFVRPPLPARPARWSWAGDLGDDPVLLSARLPQDAPDAPGRPQHCRDGPVSRRAAQPQAPRVAHNRLRRGPATLRGRPAPRRGHRQRPHGHTRPPGQGAQGPRHDARAAAADAPPRVLGGLPARAVPLPRAPVRPPGQPAHRPDGLRSRWRPRA